MVADVSKLVVSIVQRIPQTNIDYHRSGRGCIMSQVMRTTENRSTASEWEYLNDQAKLNSNMGGIVFLLPLDLLFTRVCVYVYVCVCLSVSVCVASDLLFSGGWNIIDDGRQPRTGKRRD